MSSSVQLSVGTVIRHSIFIRFTDNDHFKEIDSATNLAFDLSHHIRAPNGCSSTSLQRLRNGHLLVPVSSYSHILIAISVLQNCSVFTVLIQAEMLIHKGRGKNRNILNNDGVYTHPDINDCWCFLPANCCSICMLFSRKVSESRRSLSINSGISPFIKPFFSFRFNRAKDSISYRDYFV